MKDDVRKMMEHFNFWVTNEEYEAGIIGVSKEQPANGFHEDHHRNRIESCWESGAMASVVGRAVSEEELSEIMQTLWPIYVGPFASQEVFPDLPDKFKSDKSSEGIPTPQWLIDARKVEEESKRRNQFYEKHRVQDKLYGELMAEDFSYDDATYLKSRPEEAEKAILDKRTEKKNTVATIKKGILYYLGAFVVLMLVLNGLDFWKWWDDITGVMAYVFGLFGMIITGGIVAVTAVDKDSEMSKYGGIALFAFLFFLAIFLIGNSNR